MNEMVFQKGNIPWNKDKVGIFSIETRNKMSLAKKGKESKLKGRIPWNKGKKGCYSESTIEKHRNVMLGNKNALGLKHTEETKKTLSEKFSGVKNPNYGKSSWSKGLTKETDPRLMNISKIMVNRVFTEEHRNNLSKSGKGKTRSIELRKIISKTLKETYKLHPELAEASSKRRLGKISPMKGKHHSEETIEIIKERRSRQIFPTKDSKPERMMQIALALNGIKFEKQKLFKFGKSYHRVDIFIEPNIIIEVDGVHWHVTKRQLKRDLFQTQELTIMGYHLIRIRDMDVLEDVNKCAEKVIQLIKELNNFRGVFNW